MSEQQSTVDESEIANPVFPPESSPPDNVVSLRDTQPKTGFATTVADFRIGERDGCGRLIDDIYFKRATYVIYCHHKEAGERQVLVRYADDVDTSTKQIAVLADVIPLRNQLQSLLPEMANKERYYGEIAEALRLGLEQKIDVAKQTLEMAIKEAQAVRDANSRNVYINEAWPYASAVVGVLLALAIVFLYVGNAGFAKAWSPLGHLLITSAAGAIGALLSVAISVRSRTVATDGDAKSLKVDAWTRVLIGTISAAALYLILGTGVLSQFKIGDMTFGAGNIVWQTALLVGFAAGFLERLVPDLLEKQKPKQ